MDINAEKQRVHEELERAFGSPVEKTPGMSDRDLVEAELKAALPAEPGRPEGMSDRDYMELCFTHAANLKVEDPQYDYGLKLERSSATDLSL